MTAVPQRKEFNGVTSFQSIMDEWKRKNPAILQVKEEVDVLIQVQTKKERTDINNWFGKTLYQYKCQIEGTRHERVSPLFAKMLEQATYFCMQPSLHLLFNLEAESRLIDLETAIIVRAVIQFTSVKTAEKKPSGKIKKENKFFKFVSLRCIEPESNVTE